jgi:predicted phage baseplate assembly protein
MPLPAPTLDNRRFQDLVDEAKRLIPQFCPEWTDHNVSDPGVALVELFAWMTEGLLYRTNQVPERTYIRFLDMIGVTLEPPRAACAPVTFYLSAPRQDELTIPAGTDVATLQTETQPAVLFSTEVPVTIRPPRVVGVYTQRANLGDKGWVENDLRRLDRGESIKVFPEPPAVDDTFLLAFDADLSHHVLAITCGCVDAGGAGVDPEHPPVRWEAWQGDLERWVPCELEKDSTGGFNRDGEIVVRLPAMVEHEFSGRRAFWVRSVIVKGEHRYHVAPEIERTWRVESRGATVAARHAVTVYDETLGISSGEPGQTFTVGNAPLLARDPATDVLTVDVAGVERQQWREVAHFTGPADARCFTLDSVDGTLTLPPALLQPDGRIRRLGAVPPTGSVLRMSRYQYGGGLSGNVGLGKIEIMKTAVPYVARVRNHQPAVGGRDSQSLEDAKLRGGEYLRSAERVVTADDFEFHATRVPGVARARCLAPGSQPAGTTAIRPGQVFVIVLPEVEDPRRPSTEQVRLSDDLRRRVLDYLNPRCVIGASVEARLADVTWVSVSADLLVADGSHPAVAVEVQRQAERALYEYLNPYIGGPGKTGWPFGRDLHLSELFGLLQRIPQVEYVEKLRLQTKEPGQASFKTAPPRVPLVNFGVLCSATHTVAVRQASSDLE